MVGHLSEGAIAVRSGADSSGRTSLEQCKADGEGAAVEPESSGEEIAWPRGKPPRVSVVLTPTPRIQAHVPST